MSRLPRFLRLVFGPSTFNISKQVLCEIISRNKTNRSDSSHNTQLTVCIGSGVGGPLDHGKASKGLLLDGVVGHVDVARVAIDSEV